VIRPGFFHVPPVFLGEDFSPGGVHQPMLNSVQHSRFPFVTADRGEFAAGSLVARRGAPWQFKIYPRGNPTAVAGRNRAAAGMSLTTGG
jgi:hypothetical protein